MNYRSVIVFLCIILTTYIFVPSVMAKEEKIEINFLKERQLSIEEKNLPETMPRFVYQSERHFEYPTAIRGIYVTAYSAGGSRFNDLVDLIETTDLNAMVIDVKDDWGHVTYKLPEDSPYSDISQNIIKNPEQMMDLLEEKQIYPIARIVVFKDTTLAEDRPDLSFLEGDKVWKNRRGEAFVNPFLKEVWDYNIEIAKEAAKMGFQEIQFDYVRFPEGFESLDKTLSYSLGPYDDTDEELVQKRVSAVTDFVAYAKEQLHQYNVKVSVDIFGYSATIPEAPGIGQNFTKIAENVDVISSMIYPSHWTSYFGIPKPDLEPYKLVKEYAKVENFKLGQLQDPPISRPWLQDFTASYLGAGNYQIYGKEQVEDQIRALYESGITEFLLWNPSNRYSLGVDYTLGIDQLK